MGLFGASQKEIKLENENQLLKNEINRLHSMLTPQQQNVELLNRQLQGMRIEQQHLSGIITSQNQAIESQKQQLSLNEQQIKEQKSQLFYLENEGIYQEYALYKPTYTFANSDLYKDALTEIRNQQKKCISEDKACIGGKDWTVNDSKTKGNAMIKDLKKLLLRSFNLECDNIVDNVKVNNLDKSVERVHKVSEQISKLGKIMGVSISDYYISLKIAEIKLALDFQQVKFAEKEKLKELKAQQREEAKLQAEIEKEQQKLKKEMAHYNNALKTIEHQLQHSSSPDLLSKKEILQSHIKDIDNALEGLDYRIANKRAGYVYIISNVGAFGENVYKIGMTRRLDPSERIDELGDASVPFNFDIHAMIFSEDAPGLETALHNAFENRKINKVNPRREFFTVTLDEIKTVVRQNFDKTVEWIDIPDATQYRQSIALSHVNSEQDYK